MLPGIGFCTTTKEFRLDCACVMIINVKARVCGGGGVCVWGGGGGCMCVMHMFARARARVCVHACVRACACVSVCAHTESVCEIPHQSVYCRHTVCRSTRQQTLQLRQCFRFGWLNCERATMCVLQHVFIATPRSRDLCTPS